MTTAWKVLERASRRQLADCWNLGWDAVDIKHHKEQEGSLYAAMAGTVFTAGNRKSTQPPIFPYGSIVARSVQIYRLMQQVAHQLASIQDADSQRLGLAAQDWYELYIVGTPTAPGARKFADDLVAYIRETYKGEPQYGASARHLLIVILQKYFARWYQDIMQAPILQKLFLDSTGPTLSKIISGGVELPLVSKSKVLTNLTSLFMVTYWDVHSSITESEVWARLYAEMNQLKNAKNQAEHIYASWRHMLMTQNDTSDTVYDNIENEVFEKSGIANSAVFRSAETTIWRNWFNYLVILSDDANIRSASSLPLSITISLKLMWAIYNAASRPNTAADQVSETTFMGAWAEYVRINIPSALPTIQQAPAVSIPIVSAPPPETKVEEAVPVPKIPIPAPAVAPPTQIVGVGESMPKMVIPGQRAIFPSLSEALSRRQESMSGGQGVVAPARGATPQRAIFPNLLQALGLRGVATPPKIVSSAVKAAPTSTPRGMLNYILGGRASAESSTRLNTDAISPGIQPAMGVPPAPGIFSGILPAPGVLVPAAPAQPGAGYVPYKLRRAGVPQAPPMPGAGYVSPKLARAQAVYYGPAMPGADDEALGRYGPELPGMGDEILGRYGPELPDAAPYQEYYDAPIGPMPKGARKSNKYGDVTKGMPANLRARINRILGGRSPKGGRKVQACSSSWWRIMNKVKAGTTTLDQALFAAMTAASQQVLGIGNQDVMGYCASQGFPGPRTPMSAADRAAGRATSKAETDAQILAQYEGLLGVVQQSYNQAALTDDMKKILFYGYSSYPTTAIANESGLPEHNSKGKKCPPGSSRAGIKYPKIQIGKKSFTRGQVYSKFTKQMTGNNGAEVCAPSTKAEFGSPSYYKSAFPQSVRSAVASSMGLKSSLKRRSSGRRSSSGRRRSSHRVRFSRGHKRSHRHSHKKHSHRRRRSRSSR